MRSTRTPSPREITGFRFMLLAWGLSLLLLLISGYSYYEYQSAWDDIKAAATAHIKCEDTFIRTIPACTTPGADESCRHTLRLKCDGEFRDRHMNFLSATRDSWEDRTENYLWLAGLLFFGSTAAFYSIRWGLTGRLQPLWLLGPNTPRTSGTPVEAQMQGSKPSASRETIHTVIEVVIFVGWIYIYSQLTDKIFARSLGAILGVGVFGWPAYRLVDKYFLKERLSNNQSRFRLFIIGAILLSAIMLPFM